MIQTLNISFKNLKIIQYYYILMIFKMDNLFIPCNMYNIKKRIYMVTLMEVTYMKTKRISGFQWTLTIFVFSLLQWHCL